jgi:protein SCO1/2
VGVKVLEEGKKKRMKTFPSLVCILAGALFLSGCAHERADQRQNGAQQNSPAKGQPELYQAKGIVQSIDAQKKRVVIKHEEIPNYMAAMTMPFDVKKKEEIENLNPGDEVTFRMVITPDDGWIENIQKTGSRIPLERPAIRMVRDVEPLEEGDVMPNYSFTNTLGKKVSLYDHKGEALALTFIFTRCPFPNFCPRMSGNFAEASKILKNDPSAPANWALFSISFDPDYDTPAKLRSFSKLYGAEPGKWDFVTGAQVDIDAITEQFGLGFAYEQGTFQHNLRTVVIDAAGKVQKIFIGNEWKPEELADEIKKAAKAQPANEKQ